jgi:hypothetical protein
MFTHSRRDRLVEFIVLSAIFGGLAAVFTYPLGFHPASYARLDADGKFSIWNVAWVAHALTTDPLRVWDANIFHPVGGALAFSEANLAAGVLAIPVYLLTGNPYAAHNSVLLLSFVLSGLGAYYLVEYLVRDRRAALLSGICFSFCPYAFAHFSQIQLLLTAGLPFSLLAFHRLADDPTPRRGVMLGVAMAMQTYACAYYGVFNLLIIGFATLLMAALRNIWWSRRYWQAIAGAALVAVLLVAPLVYPYLALGLSQPTTRSLAEADLYATRGRAYLASAAYAHSWMLRFLPEWRDVLFPGFVPIVFGTVGLRAWMERGGLMRKRVWLYIGLALFAVWLSLGPRAGLYSLFHAALPGFAMLRAPSRFGIVVTLALSVFAGAAVAALLGRQKGTRAAFVAAGILALAIVESWSPTRFMRVPELPAVYRTLATLPPGAVVELPLYSSRFAFLRTGYMLNSTAHWKPLVGGYSDHTPDEFLQHEGDTGQFPTPDGFKRLFSSGVRYAVFHLDEYSTEARAALEERLTAFNGRVRFLERDGDVWLAQLLAH